jgi:hypothetical protein
LLADSAHEWQEGLRQLIESTSLRHDLGAKAYEDVRQNHTTAARARQLEEVLKGFAGRSREPLTVNWVSRDPASLPLAKFLADSGHVVRLPSPGENLAPADVSIATDLTTAELVAGHRESLFKCQLISAAEEDTACEAGLRRICLGAELADRISARTGRPADHIDGTNDRAGRQLEQILLGACFARLGLTG